MAEKIYQAVIDDGTREIPIKNKFGKLICNIYIRPSDISILDRYEKFVNELPGIIKPVQELNVKADGTVEFEEEWAAMKEAEKEFKARLNEVFDMEEADDIFRTRNPFSSVGGKFFCESVVEVIGNLITDAVEDEIALTQNRTEKYLKDIKSGKK